MIPARDVADLILITFFLGLACGFGLGLMISPSEMEELIRRLKRGVSKWKENT